MSKRIKGFTLVELMVTLAVMAIVVGIAVPSFNAQILNNRSITLSSELITAMNFARAEAVKRSAQVSICPSTNGSSCLTADDWGKGWLVFLDTAAFESSPNVTVGSPLRHWDDISDKAKVSAKKGSTGVSFVRFTSNGMLARTNAADSDARVFNVYISGCQGTSARDITLGLAGMLNSSKVECPRR